jgi:hypothetical protein
MNAQIKVGDIVGYAKDDAAGMPVRKIRIGCVYASGTYSGRMVEGDFLMTGLRAEHLIVEPEVETPAAPKLTPAMVEAMRTAGRRGVYVIYARSQTITALVARGYATRAEHPTCAARLTDAGLAVSAEIRKTSVIA